MLVPWSVRHGPHRVDIDPGKLLPVSRLVHDGTAYTDEGGEVYWFGDLMLVD